MLERSLQQSLQRARRRLGERGQGRASRSDRGASRLPAAVQRHLAGLLGGQERPPMREVLGELEAFCRREGYRVPSRATVYGLLRTAPAPSYALADLPDAVRATLHNVAPEAEVPGPLLVQRAFDVGSTAAVAFAASLPWLCLYQADRLRGWRPKSHALLRAVMRFRRI